MIRVFFHGHGFVEFLLLRFHILKPPRDSQCMEALLPDERGSIEIFPDGVNFYAVECQGIPAETRFSLFYDPERIAGGDPGRD